MFDFLGSSCVWTLQALAVDTLETKRCEKKARTEAKPKATKPVPHERFKFTHIVDNVDKVVAYCAGMNFVKGLKFLKKQFAGKVDNLVIAVSAVRYGHMSLVNAHLDGIDDFSQLIKHAAINGHLDDVMRYVDIKDVNHTHKNTFSETENVVHAFNYPNSHESRVWLLQRYVENSDDVYELCYYPCRSFDIQDGEISKIAAGINGEGGTPSGAGAHLRREDLYFAIYLLALQTNNKELALNARCRYPHIATSPLVGSSVELWREMRDIDRAFRPTSEDRRLMHDAKMLFAHACNTGTASVSDYTKKWEDRGVSFLRQCLMCSIRRGRPEAAILFAATDLDLELWEYAIVFDNKELIQALCEQKTKASKIHGEVLDMAIRHGHYRAIESMNLARVQPPSILKLDSFEMSRFDRIENALSDTRDRVRAFRKVIEKAGIIRFLIKFVEELDTEGKALLAYLEECLGKVAVADKFAEFIGGIAGASGESLSARTTYIHAVAAAARFIHISKEDLMNRGVPENIETPDGLIRPFAE
ncbi:MAG: hypothetical protein KGL39_18805 [Patescibacteria group bacterium]|nr:hypothetical protein [Patescibacteria group bacterium]